jgi:hypothetical protein
MIIYAREGTAEPFKEEYLYMNFSSITGIKVRLRTMFPTVDKTKQKLGILLLTDQSSMSLQKTPKSKPPPFKRGRNEA